MAHDTVDASPSALQIDDIQDAERSAERYSVDDFIAERLAAGSTDLYNEVVEQIERRLFAAVLQYSGGNQSKTSEILGITRGKVRDRIAAYNIQLERTVSVGK